MRYNFINLQKIKDSTDAKGQVPAMIDIIGLILTIEPVGQIQMKATGEMRDKRSITIGDESGISIGATLWGTLASNENVQVGTVMAVKGASVSDYGGRSLNISEDRCHIEYNPSKL